MKTLLLIGLASLMTSQASAGNREQVAQTLSPSALIVAPPSPAKLDLIRRFLRAIGLQDELDTGSFLERHAMPGGSMWRLPVGEQPAESLFGGIERRMAALQLAYASHRAEYQQEYESHVNWEFTEDELREIVGFLERPVGRHFLDGRWRMDAYVGTNTESIEEQIVREAIAALAR